MVDGLSFVNVQFRSEQIRFPGCGGGSALFIGYAVGHRMVAGSIDVNAEWHDVKFKATEGNFYIGEQKLLGAQVMALMENCQAKVFDPVVAAPVKEFTR